MEHKRRKCNREFVWALGPEATHQKTRSEYRTKPEKNKIDKLIKLDNRNYSPKRNKLNSRDFSRAKQTDTETQEDQWEKNIDLTKKSVFLELSAKLFTSKFLTSTTYRKLRDKLLKYKDLDIPKVVKQQNKYHRKNKTKTTPEVLISNREKNRRRTYTH